ncbi:uncharacterized protein UV8b_03906 [Ustilaginoidea virens]|uniref:Uncharacterized protein n=1 Tax=Ustilaginoidea virens TaxID=1159556 RepID=A0A8E5HQT5_USTVR|nr:uncharacterized protein UV8b_03906 [Ustilaginoidea virens]QUC19665.1 hypothetical protein UV8b_03906 [Ustilaginoidea virens]
MRWRLAVAERFKTCAWRGAELQEGLMLALEGTKELIIPVWQAVAHGPVAQDDDNCAMLDSPSVCSDVVQVGRVSPGVQGQPTQSWIPPRTMKDDESPRLGA